MVIMEFFEKFGNILTEEQLRTVIKQQNEEIKMLRSAIKKITDKNFHGGPKSDREDYSVMVSCKDI